jgi:translocator protein
MKYLSKWLSLIIFLFICLFIEIIGGLFVGTSVDSWYLELRKTSYNPPSWVFTPVWTILYIMIAISGWLVYCRPQSRKRKVALGVYAAQLLLNFLWTFFFFYLESPLLGMIDIIFLFGLVIWNVIVFWPLSRLASWLLIPYLLWTGYATLLNISLFALNWKG